MVVPAVCLRARGKRPSGCILCGGQLNPRRGRKYAFTGVGPESNSNKVSKFTPLSQSQMLTCFVRSIPCLSFVVFALPWASSWASEVQHCDSAKSGLWLSAWWSKTPPLHGIFLRRGMGSRNWSFGCKKVILVNIYIYYCYIDCYHDPSLSRLDLI